jgi:hypothetical protein
MVSEVKLFIEQSAPDSQFFNGVPKHHLLGRISISLLVLQDT